MPKDNPVDAVVVVAPKVKGAAEVADVAAPKSDPGLLAVVEPNDKPVDAADAAGWPKLRPVEAVDCGAAAPNDRPVVGATDACGVAPKLSPVEAGCVVPKLNPVEAGCVVPKLSPVVGAALAAG